MEIMLFKPIPRKAIWGHTKLKEYFNYKDYPDGIGQSWCFATQESASNVVLNGNNQGKTLTDLWIEHPEYFKSKYSRLPFIIGLVGPEDSLSIQVHPDRDYAIKHDLPSGKNEAWYFIDAKENADLIYGQNASDVNELKNYIKENKWNELIRRIPIKKDDFVYVPAGLLHAMQKDVIAYEVQEATDVTYRFYDFDREDAQGNKRPLNLEEAIDCINFDKKLMENKDERVINHYDNLIETKFVNNESFEIIKLQVSGNCIYNFKKYLLATVSRGEGSVNKIDVKLGDSFLVPVGMNEITLSGDMDLMITCEGKNY